jgi:hypothetical protein
MPQQSAQVCNYHTKAKTSEIKSLTPAAWLKAKRNAKRQSA